MFYMNGQFCAGLAGITIERTFNQKKLNYSGRLVNKVIEGGLVNGIGTFSLQWVIALL